MSFWDKLRSNRFWSWNRYTRELLLKVPLSLFAVYGAAVVALAIILSIVGGIIELL